MSPLTVHFMITALFGQRAWPSGEIEIGSFDTSDMPVVPGLRVLVCDSSDIAL
jgi:hypothetical protein